MNFIVKHFSELSTTELYEILKTKFVTIDIIQDINNNLYVLEVNSRVTMAKYIEQHK